MSYDVEIRPSAQRELARLPKREQGRVAARIDALADNPRPPGSVKPSGSSGLWRIRAGSYRIIYDIQDRRLIVQVVSIAHRREAYRGL